MTGNPQQLRVAVLGASGRVGRMFRAYSAEFLPQGHEIIPVFRGKPPVPGGVSWDPEDDIPVMQADVVLALWGVTSGDAEHLSANERLARAAVRFADAVGADRVIHCSSVAVYTPADGALDETAPTKPVNDYGKSKLDMEAAAFKASKLGGPASICLRIGNVAGADSLFLAGAAKGRITLDRFEDGGGPRRSYISPRDLARVLCTVSQGPMAWLPSIINVAAPVATPMAALAHAMGWPVSWRPAPKGARQSVEMRTERLAAVCPLPDSAANPATLVQDVRDGRWAA